MPGSLLEEAPAYSLSKLGKSTVSLSSSEVATGM